MTIGELALEAGVSVRTIQYYNKEGLLMPSARTQGNQRLYSSEDRERLYKILCLKYMGLSLAEIRERIDSCTTRDDFEELVVDEICNMETDIGNLLRKFTTLKNLKGYVSSHDDVDWSQYSQIIGGFQEEGQYFWHLSGMYEERGDEIIEEETTEAVAAIEERTQGEAAREGGMWKQWHRMVRDAIRLMRAGVPPDSPEGREIAERYLSMSDNLGHIGDSHSHHGFTIMDAAAKMTAHGNFNELRNDVNNYLKESVDAYYEAEGEDEDDGRG